MDDFKIGDRVEDVNTGQRGTVFQPEHKQHLHVKWDDGSDESCLLYTTKDIRRVEEPPQSWYAEDWEERKPEPSKPEPPVALKPGDRVYVSKEHPYGGTQGTIEREFKGFYTSPERPWWVRLDDNDRRVLVQPEMIFKLADQRNDVERELVDGFDRFADEIVGRTGEPEPKGVINTVDEILGERGKRYGDFGGHANITQAIKRVLDSGVSAERLSDSQREALHMIAHKMGRIVNGDPDYVDSWIDIAGYAQLVVDELRVVERSEQATEAKTQP